MAELVIRDEQLAWRLLDIARRENRPVEAVLESLLERYDQSMPDETKPKPGTLAALAESARRANLRSEKPVDTAARSREILHNEYPDYIRRNMDKQQPNDE